MVEKISNTKEVSSEYQKIETKLASHIDNKINYLFNKIIYVIIASSLCIIGLVTPPLLIAINIASGSEAFYFTLEKASFIFGMALFVIFTVTTIATVYFAMKRTSPPFIKIQF